MKRHSLQRTTCLFVFSLATPLCQAEQVPLWELGAGGAYINFPSYRGSDERRSYLLPAPYVAYRGEFLQISKEHMRGLFFKSDKTELEVSLNATVPVKSRDNAARTGMPDLDPTLEIGPSLNVSLMRSPSHQTELEWRVPIRPVFATNFSHVQHIGWVFQPQLNLDIRDPVGYPGWKLGLAAGPVFGDGRYHQYFYGVDSAYATSTRPAYQARGGYAGSQFITALSKRFPDFWVGGFMKWDSLQGAVFADSPLLKSKQYFTAGFAIAWVFAESKTRVNELP
ncbi:MAG: MipA/OmpV family protein [Gallionellaceae bacterium]|nr:MipA/OmpV family protein [Gallionellaceae bacterium]